MIIHDYNKLQLDARNPEQKVKLAFIHHSCGSHWLMDDNGGLAKALTAANYFVSSTNYKWGPDRIGDTTDIGHYWSWFRGPNSSQYMEAVYTLNDKNCPYTRQEEPVPAGENEIIMFKSCYPNSKVQGSISDPIPSIEDNPLKGQSYKNAFHTMGNIKSIYIDLLKYFESRQDKLFVLVTAPPLLDNTYAVNARALNNWLVYEWLRDYPHRNVAVFDFYNVLTGDGNHHRVVDGKIEHVTEQAYHTLFYPTSMDDDHPNKTGNEKATAEFVELLNVYYHAWKSNR